MKNLKVLWLLVISLLLSACNDTLESSPDDNTPEPVFNSEMSAIEAQEVLLNFLGENVKTRSNSYIEIEDYIKHNYVLPTTRGSNKETENIPVYEFITREDDKKGFALVIGDKRFNTVLAYIPEGSLEEAKQIPTTKNYFNNIPQFLNGRLSINNHLTRGGGDPEPNPGPNPNDTIIKGLDELYTAYLPTVWSQYLPYNMYVPVSCGDQNAPLGCTTLALGQIMAYHRFPQNYNWDLILSSPTVTNEDSEERKQEVAQFLLDVGENIWVNWKCGGSGGDIFYINQAIKAMGFDFTYKSYMKMGAAAEIILNSLKEGMPCYIEDHYHAYVADACGLKTHPVTYTFYNIKGQLVTKTELDTSYYFHLNLGWGGTMNGWYLGGITPSSTTLVFYEGFDYLFGEPVEENSFLATERYVDRVTSIFRPKSK